MRRRAVFFACLFLFVGACAQQIPLVYYTPRDGLINSRVRNIFQDSKGRMVFITYGGISFYDGYHFINYNHQDGLADDLVNDIAEVGPDSFLVATNASHLNTLVRGKIGEFHAGDSMRPIINRFFKTADGHWYATGDNGLFEILPGGFRRLNTTDRSGNDLGLYLDNILEWKDLFLVSPWNYTLPQKMLVVNRRTNSVIAVDHTDHIVNFAKDRNGVIWVTTTEGLCQLDTAAMRAGRILLSAPDKRFPFAGNSALLIDNDNTTWFFGKQIVRLSPAMQIQKIGAEQGLEPTSVTCLFTDREGTMWIGSDGNGVIKMRNSNIEIIRSIGGKPLSASTIAADDDTVWLYNAVSRSVCRIENGQVTEFPIASPPGAAFNLYVDRADLFINDGSSVCRISAKNRPAAYAHPVTSGVFTGLSSVGCGIMDANGYLVQYVKQNDSVFYLYVVKDDHFQMKVRVSHFIDQMCFDKSGKLWMVTRDRHLLRFRLNPQSPSKYLIEERSYGPELGEIAPRALTIDTANNIWIGTRYTGVYRFRLSGDSLLPSGHFTTTNGLTDNFVFTLASDRNNTVWVGTQTGLDKIYRRANVDIIGNVSKNNGFFQTVSRIVVTPDNTIWALATGGFIFRIGPSRPEKREALKPTLLLASMQINNQPYRGSSNQFSYDDDNLTFSFGATSYIDERAIRYSFLLQGGRLAGWSKPTTDPNFNFINLAPGRYRLHVRADFPEAMYLPATFNYDFVIMPPWWQTWWFLGLAALLVIGGVVAAIRFYYRRKLEVQRTALEKRQAIEKERTRIATDMHDDLGAGLSRIKFLSETIGIKKQQQIPFEEDITSIRQYSHEMIDKMGEIVWALNERNDTVSDLLAYTRAYAMDYLSQHGVGCTVELPDALPGTFISGEIRRNVFLSVKELLHNVVKHSQAGNVKMAMRCEKNLLVSISDDGIGFDMSNLRPYSNGLKNVQKRMADVSGTVVIESGNGTKISLSLPVAR